MRCSTLVARQWKRTVDMPTRKTAAVVVIGDEILKGTTVDTNSHFLCKKLHEIGVNLKRISVVGDDLEEISREIRRTSEAHDYVLTTGGVGPTHDDKTYMGLARAFNDEMTLSTEIRDAVQRFMPTYFSKIRSDEARSGSAEMEETLSEATEKLSTIPRSADLLWGLQSTGGVSAFPVVRMRNVITLPGVPRFCESAFEELQDQLFPPAERLSLCQETIHTDLDEFEFSKKLTELAARHDQVQIGSYPDVRNKFYKTKLTVECEDRNTLTSVTAEIRNMLKDHLVYYDSLAWKDAVTKWRAFKERQRETAPDFAHRLEEAERIVHKIVDEYPLDQIALSFNGGKDCTVLLHMLRLKVDEKFGPGMPIQGFHIMVDDQFPEATQFIIDAAKFYNITVLEFPGPLKSGLAGLKRQRPNVVAVLMGSRQTDPNGKFMKSPVEWTDSDWPRVLRVCPILKWSYSDVWKMLRGLCVPYCKLYDHGYTSLGGRDNTVRNPALRVEADDGKEYYLPAYRLKDDSAERNNRCNL